MLQSSNTNNWPQTSNRTGVATQWLQQAQQYATNIPCWELFSFKGIYWQELPCGLAAHPLSQNYTCISRNGVFSSLWCLPWQWWWCWRRQTMYSQLLLMSSVHLNIIYHSSQSDHVFTFIPDELGALTLFTIPHSQWVKWMHHEWVEKKHERHTEKVETEKERKTHWN